MAVQHRSQIKTSFGRLNQSAYGTASLSGDQYVRIISDSQETADHETSFANDAGYDQGTDMAQEYWAETVNSGVAVTPDFCFQDIGYLFKDALGGYAVSTLDTGLYRHVFTPQDVSVSRQLPSRTILKDFGSIGIWLLRDMVNSNLSMSGGKMGRIKVSGQYVGSGYLNENAGGSGYSSAALGSGKDYAYSGQLPGGIKLYEVGSAVKQVETATAAGTASATGVATATVTGIYITGSPVVVNVNITNGDTAAVIASKIRAALRATDVVIQQYEVSGSTTSIVLTDRFYRASDGTLNIAIGTGTATGVTAVPSSANTTAGVAATTSAGYSCDLETWSLNLQNPAADEGYRQCSQYWVPNDPESGAIRSEYLLGVRNYGLDFTARLQANDPQRAWLKAQTDVALEIPIIGQGDTGCSCVISHTRARITSSKPIPDAAGFIGIQGRIDLLSNNGAIPFQIILINDISSYAS